MAVIPSILDYIFFKQDYFYSVQESEESEESEEYYGSDQKIDQQPLFNEWLDFNTLNINCIGTLKDVVIRHPCISTLSTWTYVITTSKLKVPSLIVLSALTLIVRLQDTYYDEIFKLEARIKAEEDNSTIKVVTSRKCESKKYLFSMSKDVFDIMDQFHLDLTRIYYNFDTPDIRPFYANQYVFMVTRFTRMYSRLVKVGWICGMDSLRKLSVHIRQVEDYMINIFKLHHELVCALPNYPIRPDYHRMMRILGNRIQRKNKFQGK